MQEVGSANCRENHDLSKVYRLYPYRQAISMP